jgi:hypothetical protein
MLHPGSSSEVIHQAALGNSLPPLPPIQTLARLPCSPIPGDCVHRLSIWPPLLAQPLFDNPKLPEFEEALTTGLHVNQGIMPTFEILPEQLDV